MRMLCLLFSLVLFVACSSTSVETDFDPDFDFSSMKSWAWHEPVVTETDEPGVGDPIAAERVRKAIELELAQRGYTMVDAGAAPDFWVVSHASVHEEFDTEYVRSNYGYGYGTWGYGGTAQPVTYEYEEGKLVIDLLSGSDKQMVWSGSASAEVDPDASPDEREKRVSKAVAQVLAEFPPKGK